MIMKKPTKATVKTPKIGKYQMDLLKTLCNAMSVSGDEQEVRQIVLAEIEGEADEVKVDAMGNVLVTKLGKGEDRVRVMLAAHMDEIGFMLVRGDDAGLFEFVTVGGIDERQLLGKSVIVGRDHLPGVIGAKAIHLTTPEERKNVLKVNQMRIDMGLDIGSKVKVGDWATFATKFEVIGPSIRAKALDNRLGVVNLIELIKHAPENVDLLAAFTVQEEVGLRGARVAAYAFDPQIGIALDATPANDLPGWESDEENVRYNTQLDHGPAIYLMDAATMADRRLVDWLVQSAWEAGIPWQFRQPNLGGTDAGAIHKTRAGVPSVSVSVPQRYAHTAAGLIRKDDWENTLRLMHSALTRLTPEVIAR